MAVEKDAATPAEMRLEDLEWPANQKADDSADNAPAEAAPNEDAATPAAPTEWFDRTTREVGTDGSSTVDLSGLMNEKKYTYRRGDDQRDSDGDGLTDAFEGAHGTDPFNADTDNDGFSDAVESAWGMDTGTVWSPPNATADDVDGDGVPNLTEIEFGTSPVFDEHAAAGNGSDRTESGKDWYQRVSTGGENPIGDAWARQHAGVQATPQEDAQLNDAVFDAEYSGTATGKLRAADAMANFDDAAVPQDLRDGARAELQQMVDAVNQRAMNSDNPADMIGALRTDGLLGGTLTPSQTDELTGRLADGMNKEGLAGLQGQLLDTALGRGGGTSTGTGTGTGTTTGGTGTGQVSTPGESSSGHGAGSDPGAGHGAREPMAPSDPAEEPPSQPAGGGAGAGAANQPSNAGPTWADALDNLSNPPASEPDSSTSSGSRGDGGGTSLPGGIGDLNTSPTDVQSGNQPTGRAGSGEVHNDGVQDDVEFESVEVSPRSSTSILEGWPTASEPAGPSAAGSQPSSSTGDDGTNTNAGSTDNDDAPPADDPPADDPNNDEQAADNSSDEENAYVNPDADSGGGWSLGDGAGRAFVAGGGFTDGASRGDLSTISMSDLHVNVPSRGLIEHTDLGAGEGGDVGGGTGFVDMPIAGGGFTDVAPIGLQQIDLGGLIPHIGGMDPTVAFGGADLDAGFEAPSDFSASLDSFDLGADLTAMDPGAGDPSGGPPFP